MAIHGKSGVVRFGTNAVAQLRSISVNEGINTGDTTVMGSVAETHLPGIPNWEGSLECLWDETDTNGQLAATIGASLTVSFCPEGYDSGDKFYTGTATVTSRGVSSAVDGIVSLAISVKGNGALTFSTVA